MKKYLNLFLIIGLLAICTSCGKMAHTNPYPESGYPHSYPHR